MQAVETPLTQIIHRWHNGDEQAVSELTQFAYYQLRELAQKERRRIEQKFNQDLSDPAIHNTTALINEAYLKISKGDLSYVENRRQFYNMVSKVMRQVLIEHARYSNAQKRQAQELANISEVNDATDNWISLEKSIEVFSERYPRQAEALQLKYFMGMKNQEIGELLSCSHSLIEKDLRFAKGWLSLKLA